MAADKIHTHELRAAMERILAAIEESYGSEVTLDEDYYWHLDVEDAYDMSEEPKITSVGQVSDDLSEITLTPNREVGSIVNFDHSLPPFR